MERRWALFLAIPTRLVPVAEPRHRYNTKGLQVITVNARDPYKGAFAGMNEGTIEKRRLKLEQAFRHDRPCGEEIPVLSEVYGSLLALRDLVCGTDREKDQKGAY